MLSHFSQDNILSMEMLLNHDGLEFPSIERENDAGELALRSRSFEVLWPARKKLIGGPDL